MNIKIEVTNIYSKIIGFQNLSKDLKYALLDRASYVLPGARYSKLYRQQKWDGKEYLLTKTGRFPTGILSIIWSTIKRANLNPEIIDVRTPAVRDINYTWTGFELRDYQIEATKRFMEAKRGILELPTRSGKTFIASNIIKEVGTKTLYIVKGKESLYQTADDIRASISPANIGIFGDGRKEIGDITIALVESLRRVAVPQIFPHVGLLIVDEVQHAGAKNLYTTTLSIDAEYRMGMSGTAFREDNKDLKIRATTGKIIYKVPAEKLWDEGYILKPDIMWINPNAETLHRSIDYRIAYDRGIIYNKDRNTKIREIVESHPLEQILISVENITHGEQLMRILYGLNPRFMYADMGDDKRQELFSEFKEGKIKLMIATKLMNQSVTLPDLSVLINAGGRKSAIELLQKFGRVQGHGNKDRVIIYDFVDKHSPYLLNHSIKRMKKLKERGYNQIGLEHFKRAE